MPGSQLGSGLIKMRSSMVTVRNETVSWMGLVSVAAHAPVVSRLEVGATCSIGDDRSLTRRVPASATRCRDVARSESTVAVLCQSVSSVIWPLTAGKDRHNMRGLPAMRWLSCEGATTV